MSASSSHQEPRSSNGQIANPPRQLTCSERMVAILGSRKFQAISYFILTPEITDPMRFYFDAKVLYGESQILDQFIQQGCALLYLHPGAANLNPELFSMLIEFIYTKHVKSFDGAMADWGGLLEMGVILQVPGLVKYCVKKINDWMGGFDVESDDDDQDYDDLPSFSYTPYQVLELEKKFCFNRYLTRRCRIELGHSLVLTGHEVKQWFQNRRLKYYEDHNNKTVTEELNSSPAVEIALEKVDELITELDDEVRCADVSKTVRENVVATLRVEILEKNRDELKRLVMEKWAQKVAAGLVGKFKDVMIQDLIEKMKNL